MTKGLLCSLFLLLLLAESAFVLAAQPAELRVRTSVLAPTVLFDPVTRAWLDKKPEVRVAFWKNGRPPLVVDYEPGVFEGLSADVLGLVQQTMGLVFKIQRYESRDDAMRAIELGEVDMLGLNDLTQRAKFILPTEPYLLNHRVTVRKSHRLGNNIARDRLAYIGPDAQEEQQMHQSFPRSALIRHTNHLNAMASLAYSQVDAFASSSISAEYLIRQFFRNDLYIDENAVFVDKADINFAVSVRSPELLSALNQSLTAFPDAAMLRITSRWGVSKNAVIPHTSIKLSPAQIRWISAHKKVKVLVVGSYAPLTFFNDQGLVQGLSVDVLNMIGRRTGLEFEFVRSDGIANMLTRLQRHQADMIAALSVGDFRLTPEQYTRPYAISPFVIVARKPLDSDGKPKTSRCFNLALPAGNPLSNWEDESFPGIKKISVQSSARGLEMLAAGKVDCSVQTRFSANYFINHHFASDMQIASVFGPTPARIAMAVAEDHSVLKEIINEALLQTAPEVLQEMKNRWGSPIVPSTASAWSTYKYTVYSVVNIAVLFVIVFSLWNYFLRAQIKQRRNAEQALADQLQFTRTLIDGAPVSLYVRDAEGRLVQCNSAYLKFLNAKPKDVLGKTLLESDHLSHDLNAEFHEIYLEALKSGEPVFSDLEVQVNGVIYQVYHWILPYHNVHGKYIGVIGGWLDISERAHLIEKLFLVTQSAIDANRSKSAFVASMSHEIRTPISVLIGSIELLRVSDASTAQMEEHLAVAHHSAQSLLSLIGDVLDLSKIEAGAMEPLPRPTHLIDFMQSAHSLFSTIALNKKLDYTLKTNVIHSGVVIDALMLKQIVSNLLSNAIKFTHLGGVQLVLDELPESRDGYGRFAISVIDTGVGLSTAQQQLVFEPFIQANPNEHRAMGTGLGLSICKRLAALLGAQLSIDSQPGFGSRFTLVFEAELIDIEPQVVSKHIQPTSNHQLRVLVVEDHAPNRLLLCQQLEHLGHEAVPCADGETALAIWAQASPAFDLTITDCCLRSIDGYEIARRMRCWEQRMLLRPHPIFGLTADVQSEVADRCLAAGMNRCLFKPLSIETLGKLISDESKKSERRGLAANCHVGGELEKIRLLEPESYVLLANEILRTHSSDALQLASLLEESDFEGLSRLSHKILGGARLTGDRQLIDTCGLLVSAAQDGSLQDCRALVVSLLESLHTLEVRLLRK